MLVSTRIPASHHPWKHWSTALAHVLSLRLDGPGFLRVPPPPPPEAAAERPKSSSLDSENRWCHGTRCTEPGPRTAAGRYSRHVYDGGLQSRSAAGRVACKSATLKLSVRPIRDCLIPHSSRECRGLSLDTTGAERLIKAINITISVRTTITQQ